jgi:hypothetical protein
MTQNTHTLDNLLAHYNMEALHEEWRSDWSASEGQYTSDLDILEERFLDEQCRFLGLEEDVHTAIMAGRSLFDREPLLRRLLWHTHYTGFKHKFPNPSAFKWPAIPNTIDQAAPLFYAYVFLSGIPTILAHHRNLGLSHQVSVDTLQELQFWIKDERRKKNRWGLDHAQVDWLGLHYSGELYQLGRLQFQFSKYYYDFNTYRHRSTGYVVILANDGMEFRADGQFNGIHGITAPQSWPASLAISEKTITGHPIHPFGYALPEQINLPTNEWDLILKKGDPTIAVHILGSGPMDYDACRVSFKDVFEFWKRFFPEYYSHAFTCSSWLLDQQFETTLKPESNIVRFLKEWYLTPVARVSDKETIRRVFGVPDADLEDIVHLPRKTSLQHAVVKHMQAGGRWRFGAGVMFPHNFGWGDQVYRRDFKAIVGEL